MLRAAERKLQELEEEVRASWEERAVYYATRVTNLAGKAYETLDGTKWSRRDCTEYQDELDWEMRAFRRISNKLELSEMLARMPKAGWLREDRVNHEYHHAVRVVGRILQVHEGRPREAGGPPPGDGVSGRAPGRPRACLGTGVRGISSQGQATHSAGC